MADTFNVIPDASVIRGTARWFDDRVGELLEHRTRELATSIAAAFNCQANIVFERLYPATVNNISAAQLVRNVAANDPVNLNVIDCSPSMGAEDFSYMLQAVLGCYCWLGAGSEFGR